MEKAMSTTEWEGFSEARPGLVARRRRPPTLN